LLRASWKSGFSRTACSAAAIASSNRAMDW
jgi:hypothetical protein